MSELDKIKSKAKITKWLTDVNFNHEDAHIAYTSKGGACSLMNEAYVLKSKDDKELTEKELYILERDGNKTEAVTKQSQEKPSVTDTEHSTKGKTSDMSEDILKGLEKKVQELEHENAVMKTLGKSSKYGLEDQTQADLASAIAGLEDTAQESVFKALDAVAAKADEAISKSKESEDSTVESQISKELDKEVGSEASEETVDKSLNSRIKAANAEKTKGAV